MCGLMQVRRKMQGRRCGVIGWGYKELWADQEPEEIDEGTGVIGLALAVSFPM